MLRYKAAILVWCFAFILSPQNLYAGIETEAENAMPVVTVFGNASLQNDTVVRMSGLYQDPRLSAAELRKRLLTPGMFSRVQVFRDEKHVTIYLQEKTTWFVLPYFSKDSSATTYGLAFGKYTFFHRDASVVGRYQVGTGDHEASLLVRDETLFDTPWMVGASADYEDALHRVYSGRSVQTRTLNQMAGGSLQVGYKVTPYLSFALNNYIERHRFEELSGEYFKGVQWTHRFITDYSKFYVNEGLSEGFGGRAYFEHTNPAGTFHFWKAGLSGQAGLYKNGNLNLITRGRAEFSPSLPRYQLFELGGGKLRGYPAQEFRDRYYVSVQNDLLLTSLSVWQLRFRPLIYTDWAFVSSSGRTALGAGFQVFLKNVAVPAIQFFAGYGFNPNGFEMSASIGPQI